MPASDGLVFHAKWGDGQVTKMSVYTVGDLDLKRAIIVSTAAMSSRLQLPMNQLGVTIVTAGFRKDGAVIREYSAQELAEAMS